MSVCICDVCDSLIDLDWHEGEWDIQNRDGDDYGFVCQDCVCNNEDFVHCDQCDELTTDDKSTVCEMSGERTCEDCYKKEHDIQLALYISETGINPYKKEAG